MFRSNPEQEPEKVLDNPRAYQLQGTHSCADQDGVAMMQPFCVGSNGIGMKPPFFIIRAVNNHPPDEAISVARVI